jgi:hypothetical protein
MLWTGSAGCYKHWSTLVIRDNDCTGTFLYSKEGVTQGLSLLLPSDYYHSFVLSSYSFQRWIRLGTRDAGAGGKFDAIKRHFEKLEEIGPHGFPRAFESILIVPQKNYSRR